MLWEVDKETGKGKCLKKWKGHTKRVEDLAVLDKGWVLSASKDHTIKCWEGIQPLIKIIKEPVFDLLKIARIFLVQEFGSNLSIDIKFQILETSIGESRKFLPKAIISRCLAYAADRSTLHENALNKEEFLTYLGLREDGNIENAPRFEAKIETQSETVLESHKRERESSPNFLRNPWERPAQRIKVSTTEEDAGEKPPYMPLNKG